MSEALGRRIFYRFTPEELEDINAMSSLAQAPRFNPIHENQKYPGTCTNVMTDTDGKELINAVVQCDGGITKWVTSIKNEYDPAHALPAKGAFQWGRN